MNIYSSFLLFTTLLLGVSCVASAWEDNCSKTCETPITEAAPIADPSDCRKFYMCVPGDEANPVGPIECPPGHEYNVTDRACVEDTDGECDPCGPSSGSCAYECDPTAKNEYKVDPFDCSVYYECSYTIKADQVKTCDSETPFFDGKTCQNDESKCCHCKPFCTIDSITGTRKIADPLDCTGFYYCFAENEISTYHSKCPEGEHFNPSVRECSATYPCTTLCINVVNSEGCIDIFTCPAAGYFPVCPGRCGTQYYHCQQANTVAPPTPCPGEQVYHPDTSQCVDLDQCPYPLPGP